MIAWGRVLRVVFKSSKRKQVMEFNTEEESNSLILEVTGTKYLSPLKDEFVIDIYNLTYSEILKLIKGEFNEVDIYAGYQSSSVSRIFSGKVFYISNERESRETNIVHVICVNKLMGLYNSKMNLTLNSGINMYGAIDFIFRQAGVKDSNVSERFKRQFTNDIMNVKGTPSSFLEAFTNASTSYAAQVDASNGATFSLWDLKKSDRRVIEIMSSKGMIINGFPTLTTDGLRFDSLPVFNFMPGDSLLIDNRLIDMTISTLDEATRSNLSIYLDTSRSDGRGQYILYEINYKLSNAKGEFKLTLKSKSTQLLSNIIGGNTNG